MTNQDVPALIGAVDRLLACWDGAMNQILRRNYAASAARIRRRQARLRALLWRWGR